MSNTIHNPRAWEHMEKESCYNHNYYRNPQTGEMKNVMNSTTAALSTVWMRISKEENTLEIVIVKTTIGIVKKTLNLNITHNGTPLQKKPGM